MLCLFHHIGTSIRVHRASWESHVTFGRLCLLLEAFFPYEVLFFLIQVMDRLSSSASTVPSLDDYFEHNMWNPLDSLFLEQANSIFASYLVDIDLDMIALACHFPLDLLCSKGVFESA